MYRIGQLLFALFAKHPTKNMSFIKKKRYIYSHNLIFIFRFTI